MMECYDYILRNACRHDDAYGNGKFRKDYHCSMAKTLLSEYAFFIRRKLGSWADAIDRHTVVHIDDFTIEYDSRGKRVTASLADTLKEEYTFLQLLK